MATAISHIPAIERDRFYRVAEAAECIRLSERTIRDGINHLGWPHSRIGRRLVISGDDLLAIYGLYRTPVAKPRRRTA
ncbi:hypothetical protein [Kitasatospora sp. NPDC056181]|uniref:hypothetical protein n=1 Tax=Kitasatospora sp. NPDC056181 TaxID=3345737 RepID=UPI0035D67548